MSADLEVILALANTANYVGTQFIMLSCYIPHVLHVKRYSKDRENPTVINKNPFMPSFKLKQSALRPISAV